MTTFRIRVALIIAASLTGTLSGAEKAEIAATPTFKQYCFGCHGKSAAMGGINLESLTSHTAMGEDFQHWEKVVAVLEQKRMPPKKMPQPTDVQRAGAVTWIRTKLDDYAQKHAGDPGAVTMRRLTSAEYGYTIQDLTGIDLKFDRDFASDSVGGEGFTNFGDVQFMEDANLQRYLDAAKRVASHAVIGSGPLDFFENPGRSGFELSAISRIQDIYRTHGFRAVAGEGGKAYGLDRYGKAFYAAWRYRHRAALAQPKLTLAKLAAEEGLTPRFLDHIWSVLQQPAPTYPTSEVVSRWKNLPPPETPAKTVRASCEEIQRSVIEWPRWLFAAGELAAGGQGDERALVLTDASLQATVKHRFKFGLRNGAQKTSRVYLSVLPANPNARDNPMVLWRNATVRMRRADKGFADPQPLSSMVDAATAARLGFGKRPDGLAINPEDFVTPDKATIAIDLPSPEDARGVELTVDVELGSEGSDDAVLRCTISDREEAATGRPVWALLGYPQSAGFQSWKKGVLEYAAVLPQISHGEPTPSDKDPIPPPFNNTYNQPERDRFHTQVKYFRDDRFLVEKMLDDTTRVKLGNAWTDLHSSFEYHNLFLRFVADKFHLDLKKKGIADLTDREIAALPAESRRYVTALRREHSATNRARATARPGHVEDCVRFASKAWRRPLTESEKAGLRSFYTKTRTGPEVDHEKAIQTLLTRILVAPAFLYRLEQPAPVSAVRPLSGLEMASRLSYFLWSSMPDQELRRAAGAGELSRPSTLELQVKRMLTDPKARRLSSEFFGQWLGFYRFDQYKGVDSTRFPEFTDEVKSSMHDEAVAFFEHVVRKDRPVREMLFADYTFLNKPLAKHYGIKQEIRSADEPEMVTGAGSLQRGGLLRLGAVLTATSAPLRTSPVKRGDWVLRRILGTPTPPPPADAGSIPADDKSFGGMTVRERLAAHQRNATCAGCHSRIDPMGFPLERYDPVGRWRDKYADGKPIDDSSEMADKTPIAGVDGLLEYLKQQEPQVLRTFSNKLVGYALGRTVLGSDRQLIERLTRDGGDTPFSKMITEIAVSKQFRFRREREESTPAVPSSNSPQQSARNPATVSGQKHPTKEGGL